MHPVKRLMVGIDQSPTDEILLRFCSGFAEQLDVDRIYLVHAAASLELPDPIMEKYPDLIAPVDENIQYETTFLVDQYFSNALKSRTEILILEGNPLKTLLKEIVVKEIDILLMGKKSGSASSGFLARKMAQLANCSVTMINQDLSFSGERNQEKKVLIPVDFSEHSILALEMANLLYGKIGKLKLDLHHVYRVPAGYHYGGKSFDEFAEIMKENSREQMIQLLKNAGINSSQISEIYTLDRDQNIPLIIADTIKRNHYDLVIMGSKGRTAAASLFLGSNAEKLIEMIDKSMIVVKDKHHNLGLVEALLQV
jgi:nucleotide-binding universal stress UspA family protein